MKLRRKLWLGAGVVTLLPVLFLVEEHFRGNWALERWKARMTARGEKFEIDSLTPLLPDDADNGLPKLIWFASQLTAVSEIANITPPTARLAATGKLVFIPAQTEWRWSVGSKSETNLNWSILAEALAKINQPLEEVRAALKKPAFDARVNYQGGLNFALPHLTRLRGTASYLAAAAMNDLHHGRLEQALENLEALLALTHCQQNELFVVSQLVRIAIAHIGLSATWQALHAPGWTDSQLARLQAAWQSMEFIGAMGRSLEMERAISSVSYQNARRSAQGAWAIFDPSAGGGGGGATVAITSLDQLVDYVSNHFPDLFQKSVHIPLWRFVWSSQDELNHLRVMQTLIEAAREAAKRKSGVAVAALVDRLEREGGQLGFYNRMRFAISVQSTDWAPRTIAKAVDCETLRQLVLAAIALKRYELAHQRTAPNLAALTPEFLPEPPTDYMDGRTLRFRASTNGNFRLYSVGKNQVDEKGDPNPVSGKGVFLNHSYNWANGRDIVWPEAASPEEILASGWTRNGK